MKRYVVLVMAGVLLAMPSHGIGAEVTVESITSDRSEVSVSMTEFEGAKSAHYLRTIPRQATEFIYMAEGRRGHLAAFLYGRAKRGVEARNKWWAHEDVGKDWAARLFGEDISLDWGEQFEIDTQFGEMDYKVFALSLTKKEVPPFGCMSFFRGFDPRRYGGSSKKIEGIFCVPSKNKISGKIAARFLQSIRIEGR